MGKRDFLICMNARAEGMHIWQITSAHVTTNNLRIIASVSYAVPKRVSILLPDVNFK